MASPLISVANTKPGQDGDRKVTSRQATVEVRRQVSEIDLRGRERVETGYGPYRIDQDLGCGKVLFLMLQRLVRQPVVNLSLTAAEC